MTRQAGTAAAVAILDRIAKLEELTLGSGSHADFEAGVCALEAVAWLAGEPHSDTPACTCPVISSVVRSWNDALPDDESRNRLIKPLLAKMVGTRIDSDSVRLKRMYMVQDWHIRVRAPAFLRLAKLEKEAAALEACGEVVDQESMAACEPASIAARSAASIAARSAAESAARSAARSAASSAAESAAWSAASSAAWSAAESAASSAAESAASSAASSALQGTVSAVQASFVELLGRLCEVQS